MSNIHTRQTEAGEQVPADNANALAQVAVYYEDASRELDKSVAALGEWVKAYAVLATREQFAGILLLSAAYTGERQILDGLAVVLEQILPPSEAKLNG